MPAYPLHGAPTSRTAYTLAHPPSAPTQSSSAKPPQAYSQPPPGTGPAPTAAIHSPLRSCPFDGRPPPNEPTVKSAPASRLCHCSLLMTRYSCSLLFVLALLVLISPNPQEIVLSTGANGVPNERTCSLGLSSRFLRAAELRKPASPPTPPPVQNSPLLSFVIPQPLPPKPCFSSTPHTPN